MAAKLNIQTLVKAGIPLCKPFFDMLLSNNLGIQNPLLEIEPSESATTRQGALGFLRHKLDQEGVNSGQAFR